MKKAAGAIAIEAVLSLTIFMLAILALMMGSLLIRTQSAMQYALNQTAKEISGYFYLLDKIGIASAISGNATKSAQANVQQLNDTARHIISFSGGLSDELGELSETGQQVMSNVKDGTFSEDDINRIKGLKEDTEEFKQEISVIKNDLMELKKCNKPMMFKGIIQVFGKSLINSAVSKYITPYVCEALMPKYLVNDTGKKAKDKDGNDVSLESLFYKNAGIIESSIDFQDSKILEDGRSITLVVNYKVDASKLTLGFYKKELQFHQMASTCAWVRENDTDSLLSLSEVNEFYDPERIEKKAEELNDVRHQEEAARQAEEEARKKLQEELEKHVVDEKDKDDKDDKDDKSKSDIELPAGAAPSVEFKAAYDKLTDAQKQEFNWNYTYLLNNYGIDLVEAINNMSDKDAAMQMVLDKAINGGMLLCYYGEDGLKAYSQLDAHSRTLLLYGRIRPNDPRALDLIELILNEKRTQITADDIDAVIKASKTKDTGKDDKDKEGKVTLPAGVNGNAAFLKAYDKLTDAQKEQYNKLQASVKKRPPYEYDLTAVLNGCSDKDAVLQFLLQEKHPEDVAWILAVYGESGFEAYQKLDADSREFLLNGPWRTGSTSDSDLIKLNRELLNLILDENRSKITMDDLNNIQKKAEKKPEDATTVAPAAGSTTSATPKDQNTPITERKFLNKCKNNRIPKMYNKLSDEEKERFLLALTTYDSNGDPILNKHLFDLVVSSEDPMRLMRFLGEDQQNYDSSTWELEKKLRTETIEKAQLLNTIGNKDLHLETYKDTLSEKLTSDEIYDILAAKKGTRPKAEDYLSEEYRNDHLQQFKDEGFVVIQTGYSYYKYTANKKGDHNVGYGADTNDPKGSCFVLPKSTADKIMNEAQAVFRKDGKDAYYRYLEEALGFQPNTMKSDEQIFKIEISSDDIKKDPNSYGLRMANGNEAGANGMWVPGGFTSGGNPEAIVDRFEVDQSKITWMFDGNDIPGTNAPWDTEWEDD
ncbi:MAG: pilus assembly protein [Oscillospiraceae bacterium]|nr:pilus assembly protein [Oscillospiraceae bacterium]